MCFFKRTLTNVHEPGLVGSTTLLEPFGDIGGNRNSSTANLLRKAIDL